MVIKPQILNASLNPNPASDIAILEIILSEKSDIIIEILDLIGNRINRYTLNGAASYKKLITVDHMKTGVYIVVINSISDKLAINLKVR